MTICRSTVRNSTEKDTGQHSLHRKPKRPYCNHTTYTFRRGLEIELGFEVLTQSTLDVALQCAGVVHAAQRRVRQRDDVGELHLLVRLCSMHSAGLVAGTHVQRTSDKTTERANPNTSAKIDTYGSRKQKAQRIYELRGKHMRSGEDAAYA